MNTFILFFSVLIIIVTILLEKRNKACNFAKLDDK